MVSIVLLSTLAAVYPAYAASRLEPREALHHV
jgi:ABC-type lipoprotein release transport system permease subunit